MANYPTSLDSFTNPTGVDSLSSPSHSLQHADANDAIEALEAKLGIGNSPAGSATAGRVLVASSGGSTSWTTVSAGAISTTGGTAGQYLSAGTAGVAQWADVTPTALVQIIPASITKGASGSASVSAGGAVTFTGTESISLNTCFSSTYQNYRIMVNLSNASGTNVPINLRFRSGTTDTTSTYTWGHAWFRANSSVNGFGSSSDSSIRVGYTNNYFSSASMDIYSPNENRVTEMNFGGFGYDSSTNFALGGGGNHNTSSVFDGFTIFCGSGLMTGTIRIYGLRNG